MKNVINRGVARCCVVISLSASLALPALAQRAVTRADLVGEWSGPIALDAGTQNLSLVFRAADTTLAGTVYSDGAKFGDMESLTLVGTTVHFKLDRLDFTGMIDGATMKVALIVYNGSTRNLTLKKVPRSQGDSATAPRKPPRK